MFSSAIDFGVLGPMAVLRDDAEIALGGPRQRLVLAMLLLQPGHVVQVERLIEAIWGEAPSPRGRGPLRTQIWQIRRLVGCVESAPSGYRLDIRPTQVDSHRFEALFAAARATIDVPFRAMGMLDRALHLWRGAAFGELGVHPALLSEAERLDQLRLGAQELRAELMLTTGQHVPLVADLTTLTREHPERERLWAILMTALYRSGRQRDALRCFQEARERLVSDLGIEPGPQLRELDEAIRRHDPSLFRPVRSGPGNRRVGTDSQGQNRTLPRRLTSLIGRQAECRELIGKLNTSRLMTLTGPGGCGKTRLALEVAKAMADHSDDAVIFADMTEPTMRLDHLTDRVGQSSTLLLLDGCERSLDAAASTVELLLQQYPWLRILATSRHRLDLDAELVWLVPPLSLPLNVDPEDPATLLRSEAVQLFLERGCNALAGFDPRGDSLAVVARICRRLDGMPLAIELAATLVGGLPVADIAEHLDDRLDLLASGPRQGVERHRSLRASLDWSFGMLGEEDQALVARLATFVGGFTRYAAERVAGAGCAGALQRLRAASLLNCVADDDGTSRYRMLETERLYCLERLEQLGVGQRVRRRHALYYTELLEQAEPALVVAELANVQAAREWADANDVELAERIAGASQAVVTQLGRPIPPADDEAMPLIDLALASHESRQLDLAGTLASQAVTLARLRQDRQLQHISLCVLGRVELSRGNLAEARSLLVRSIRAFPGAEDQAMLAMGLEGLAGLAEIAGAHTESAALVGYIGALRERWQIPLARGRRLTVDDWRDRVRQAIGAERLKLQLEKGRDLDLHGAVALAESATEGVAAD